MTRYEHKLKRLYVEELPDDIRDAVKRCIRADGPGTKKEIMDANRELKDLGFAIDSWGGDRTVSHVLQNYGDVFERILIRVSAVAKVIDADEIDARTQAALEAMTANTRKLADEILSELDAEGEKS